MKNVKIKIILTAILISSFIVAFSQTRLPEYTASNGITYHPGDTVKLGRGSAPNGDFLYLQMGGWAAVMGYDQSKNSDQFNIGRHYSGSNVIIKKIVKTKMGRKGAEQISFVVGGGNISNYNLLIEDAIVTCEIADCKATTPAVVIQQQSDKFDQLKKLKALLDEGTITQAEYDAEKAKLLAKE